MENIVTAKELAGCLKLTEATIYKLASRGELPGFKIGDSWRFDIDEILKLIRGVKKKTRNRKESRFYPQMHHGNHIPLKIHLKNPVVQGDNEPHLDRVGVAKRRELIYL